MKRHLWSLGYRLVFGPLAIISTSSCDAAPSVQADDAVVAVEFDGTTDWAKPEMEPTIAPILRIPKDYLSPAAVEAARNDHLVVRNIEVGVPMDHSALTNAEDEVTDGVVIITLGESADGWAERSQRAIRYARELQGATHDPATGLDRVLINWSPRTSIRHRYVIPSDADSEAVQLDCVNFEDPARQDTCRMDIMPVRNVLASIHIKASGARHWRQRAADLRRLVSSWQEHR